jgi:hypothetical protein
MVQVGQFVASKPSQNNEVSLGDGCRTVKRVIAMMTHSLLSLPFVANPSSGGAPTPRQAPNQRQTHFEQFEPPSDFATGSDLFHATVQISPIRSVKRHSTGWHGLVAESIYTPVGSTTEFRFDAPVHLLVIYDEGARCEGETSIDTLAARKGNLPEGAISRGPSMAPM